MDMGDDGRTSSAASFLAEKKLIVTMIGAECYLCSAPTGKILTCSNARDDPSRDIIIVTLISIVPLYLAAHSPVTDHQNNLIGSDSEQALKR